MNRDGFFLLSDKVDVAKLADEADAFAEKFEDNGVKVYWLEFPEKPMAGFGPLGFAQYESILLDSPDYQTSIIVSNVGRIRQIKVLKK